MDNNYNQNTNLNNNFSNSNMNQPQLNNQNIYNQPAVNQNVGTNNGVNFNQAPKKNNTMTIVIVIVAILLVSVGAFVVYSAFSSIDDNASSNNSNKVEDVKDDEDKDNVKLHEFSEYENYNFTMDITMKYGGYTLTTASTGTADVKNSTDYIVTTASYEGSYSTSYAYDDYINGYTYTSSDKVNWEAEETEGTESIKLSGIIDKINSNDSDVTKLGDNHYSVKVDFESGGSTYNGVYADVHTSNGYITMLSYDLTSLYASQGYEKFTIDFKLSDFNEAGDVVIPDSVTGSTTTSASI